MDQLRTERRLLQRWRNEDEPAIAHIDRDPKVGRHLNRPSDAPVVAALFEQKLRWASPA